jgi:tight adherence protein B
MKQLVIILSIVTVGLIIEAVYLVLRDKVGQRDKSISESLLALRAETVAKKSESGILRVWVLSRNPSINRLLGYLPFAEKLDNLLEQAHLRMLLDRFLLIVALAGLVCSSGAYIATNNPVLGLLGLVGGGMVPWMYVLYIKRRRTAKLSEQLPEALDTLVRSLRAGYALATAFEVVAKELPAPISTEFAKIREEGKLGVSLTDSMEHLMQRCDNVDVRLFVTSVLIQWEIGGNLTEILANLSYTIRERFKLRGHVKALTGEGRLSGLVLGLLPLFVGLLIYYLNPGYMEPLLETPVGKSALVSAVVLVLLGWLLIRRIVSIKI